MTKTAASIRNQEELKLMRKSGQISALALKKVLESVRPGISLRQLNRVAEEEILRLDGKHSFKAVPGYLWGSCLNINEEVVHGIPRDITLKAGDVLKVDLGAVYKGWHTDTAWTVVVGEDADPQKKQFLKSGEESLWAAVNQAVEGHRIGDISSAMQQVIEEAGYSVVKSLAGHGVGRSGHEEPEVPTYGQRGTGLILKKGMTLAVEVIYAAGRGEIYQKADGWTLATKDGSLGGIFEMSLIVGDRKAEVLTDWRKV
ncbi:MAG: Methionine aminopeptidase [Candidatus Daviesbacteria bacterium GW2011_GWA1_41_61]|uniref:Methionine aminopeptidase n=1 Tax=Candidatus Daviesbacteria bacterium GW2011_GWA2_40_9 TaxID=1618424 RepID=A0A0G0TZ33_9BACT|nr:MAG: Methionine aminopeptidase [Candidatus Daviesbacteria bacterium GW2011_GWC1_40_9]KKR82088.1 MAG: Methionine aminopeptidase [Candidatus Daviesbacteria bacterium GW2011_GWA2_40_9]KKR93271.1 MAG: Methionine aminopeptidase [Candidatus Daviesbacteria bacterium GW2011_GWB1_41_15]KKS14759.1 MAG: Methionine aminopeptidase [Candidatus Daviesbacteria bacterium GW2011_GWA1_41_61]